MLTVDPQNNIEIDRGDGESITFSVVDAAGAALSVAGWSFAFTVKQGIDDDILAAKFQKLSAGGLGITVQPGGVTGKVVVQLADADTQALAGAYVYDLQGYDGTYTHTVAKGRFRVSKDVTTPGTAGQPSAGVVIFPGGKFAVGPNGEFYLFDLATLLWTGFKVNGENWQQSSTQSATIPFSF
jgi:hypothetical protein